MIAGVQREESVTNTEYEAACVTAAKCYDRFEGEHKLKSVDAAIGHAEALLSRLQEQRREIVNQYNLNKCEHNYVWHSGFNLWCCADCGVKKR